ncbi:MAG: class I SAM-dependent methyltransferase [Rickettsiales bacterium]|nr:MAG: class I SAM-dependent methyltransferase [Rickettsiales bacterium]
MSNNVLFNNNDDYGTLASEINDAMFENIIVPEKIRDEIPTLNKHGYMKIEIDEFSQEFINIAKNTSDTLLEMGTAYGYTVQKVLENGGKIVANDLSHEHLKILIKNTKKEYRKNLLIKQGAFPDIDFPENSFASILTSRMMHFLDVDQFKLGMKKIHNWLKPSGKFIFITLSPYHYTLNEHFQPIFNKRWSLGDHWPGLIDNNKELAGVLADDVPDFIQVFDVEQLELLMPQFGFNIDKVKLFDYESNDSNGKGHVGMIATKISS